MFQLRVAKLRKPYDGAVVVAGVDLKLDPDFTVLENLFAVVQVDFAKAIPCSG